MEHKPPPDIRIREIDRDSLGEIALVAERMRLTLIERVGEERAVEMYSMDSLIKRVQWHLDPNQTNAKIFLLEDGAGEVVGQAITRIEHDDNGKAFGYFSTIYVVPELRNKGLATTLMLKVEAWLRKMKMPKIVYNTAADHEVLIHLYARHGYTITLREGEMVQLTKQLD